MGVQVAYTKAKQEEAYLLFIERVLVQIHPDKLDVPSLQRFSGDREDVVALKKSGKGS
jgi:hypothetical protein